MLNQNQILIKNKSGQIRPVSLDIQARNALPTQDAAVSVGVIEKKEAEKFEPKFNLVTKETAMPAFYFHLEDEEEAAQFKSQEQIKAQTKKQVIIDYLIDDIIKKIALSIDEGSGNRLRRVIESRLRDVRDLIETKESLLKPKVLGGAGLDNIQVKDVLKIIEKYRIKLYEGKDLEAEIIGFRKNEPDSFLIKQNISVRENEKIGMQKNKSEQAVRIFEPNYPPTSQDIRKPESRILPFVNSQQFKRQATASYQLNQKEFMPLASNRPIYGSIEELAHITLDDLRYMSKNFSESLAKIKQKIEMLKDESYEKRTLGIKAWRQSPAYLNYLTLGRQGVEEGKDVAQIIKEKQLQSELCLTWDEFMAVADFNEELAY